MESPGSRQRLYYAHLLEPVESCVRRVTTLLCEAAMGVVAPSVARSSSAWLADDGIHRAVKVRRRSLIHLISVGMYQLVQA